MVKSISLPAPAILSAPLKDALSQRRTNRECSSEALTDAELAALLWASAGITADDGRRTTPSTLDLRAVSPYVLRKDGVWRWDAAQNELEQLASEDVRKVSTAYQFEYVEKAPVTIAFVVDTERARPLVRRDHMWTRAPWGKAAILPPHHLDSQAASEHLLTMMNCARP